MKQYSFKGLCPLKIPTNGSALLKPALRSERHWFAIFVIKSGKHPRVNHANKIDIKLKGKIYGKCKS